MDKNGIARSTQSQTFAQVLKDLTAAEELLALPASQNPVRANKETVWALRARYHLYQKEWDLAASYAKKVLDNKTSYQLIKPYGAFFSPASAIATKESVFELSYSSTYTNSHRNQWQPPANGGTRQIAPNDAFIALLNNPEVGGNRNVLVARTSAGLWYGNLYYRSPATDPAYIIRIAEVYLILAEALAHQNDLAGALQNLNLVRDRAGLKSSNVNTQAEILLAIENERRMEFALEPHRWFDLVRTGRAAAVLGITDEAKYFLPIPASEISVDPSLDQNNGY
jgi:hypothetical protein